MGAKGLGGVFRLHRKKKNIKLETIFNETGIPIKKISKFETGKAKLNIESIKKIYKCLDIDYCRSEEEISNFFEIFNIFYGQVIRYEPFSDSFNKINNLKANIQTTEIYPHFLLAKLIFNIYRNCPDNYNDIIEQLEESLEYFNDKFKQIFFDTVGTYFKHLERYDIAIEYFNKAETYNFEEISALVYYHKACALSIIGYLFNAMNCLNIAKRLFDSYDNYKRSTLCSILMGDIYTGLGLYENAFIHYKQSIDHLSLFEMIHDEISAYIKLTWSCILCEKYIESLYYTEKILGVDKNNYLAYFYKSYVYSRLNNIELAKENILIAKKIIKYNTTSMPCIELLIDTFYTLLSDKKTLKTKMNKLDAVLNRVKKSSNYQLEIFVTELIIKEYEKENKYNIAFFYQKKIIDLYKRRK